MSRVLIGLLLLAGFAIPLQGCSHGTGAITPAGDATIAGTGPTAVAWPAVNELPRSVTDTGPVITGAEYLPAAMTAQNVSTDGSAAVFASTAPAPARGDTMACALYGADLSGWRGGAILDFTVDAWDDSWECWFGLANHRLTRWDWRTIDPRESCVVVELAHYLDDADQLYFIVAMATESAVSLETIAIYGDIPVAVLETTPEKTNGETPLSIDFDASGSTWRGGSPADFQWDFDGDWVFNEEDNGELAAQGSATANHEYTTTLTVDAHLLVLGDEGVGRYASVTIAPTQIAHPLLTEAEYPVSIITLDGIPMLLYCDLDDDEFRLCLVRGDGAGGWLPVKVLDTDSFPFKEPGLIFTNGNLALVYALDHHPVGTIYYMTSMDVNGDNWNPPVQAGLNWGNAAIELAVINGRPAICWLDDDEGNDLVFAMAEDAAGTTWGPKVLIAEDIMRHITTNAPEFSLATVDGMPAVAYHDYRYNAADDRLMYVRATAADGSAWGTPLEIDSPAEKEPGHWPTLTVIDGVPVITYTAGIKVSFLTQSDIRYIRAEDATGTAWTTPVLLDELPVNDHRCALEIGDPTGYCTARDTFATGPGGADIREVHCLNVKDGELYTIWCVLRGQDGEFSQLFNLSGPSSEYLSAMHCRVRTEESLIGIGPLARRRVDYYLECYILKATMAGPEILRVERLIHTDWLID